MHRALFVHVQPDVLKSLIFMSQAKKVVRHVDKRAPGKIQEHMVEQGLGVASNSSPLTICCTAPFFFFQTHKNQKTVFVCRQMTIPGCPWYYQQSEQSITMKTSLLHHSSHMEITWSLPIKYRVSNTASVLEDDHILCCFWLG